MENNPIPNGQSHVMATVATVAPLVVVAASANWLTTLAFGGIWAIYLLFAPQSVARKPRKKWVYTFYIVANGFLTAYAAAMTVRAYPISQAFPWLPLAFLAVGTWVASKGAAAVARFAVVLGLFILAPLAAVLLFAAPEIRLENLYPTLYIEDGLAILAVGLLPAYGLWLPQKGSAKSKGWVLVILGLAVATSLVCGGALGERLVGAVEEPFYEMTKSISLFGVMERFEALVATVLLLGFGVLLAYLSAIGAQLAMLLWSNVPTKFASLPNAIIALAFLFTLNRIPAIIPFVVTILAIPRMERP